MFVGHYGPSFALRRYGGVPLWVLFLSVQFVDVLWSILILTGVEKARLVPGFTASSPLDLYYMPYTHSLAASIGWALILGWLGSLVWKRRGGVAIGACVLSHWVLDLPVHVRDLPLYGDQLKVGFGLWNNMPVAFAVEAAVLLIGAWMYARHARTPLAIWIFAFVLLAVQGVNLFIPPPGSLNQFAFMALGSYVGFAVAAWYVEGKWGQSARTGVLG